MAIFLVMLFLQVVMLLLHWGLLVSSRTWLEEWYGKQGQSKFVFLALATGWSIGIWGTTVTRNTQESERAEESYRLVASQLTGDEKFFHGKVSAVIRQPTSVVVENRLFSVTEAQTKLLQVGQKVSFIYSEGDENKTTAAVRYIIRSE